MDYLLQKKTIFKNPKKLPLNELNLEVKRWKRIRKVDKEQDIDKVKSGLLKSYDVRTEKVSALDKSWVQKDRTYHFYQPYYVELSSSENASFYTQNILFIESLDFLLQCSFQQFWCYMIYEPKIKKVLTSFVCYALPWYEIKFIECDTLALYSEIYNKVAQIYARLFTYKESEEEYMSEQTVIKFIKDKHIFTFPIILHLCLLYKNTNQGVINMLIKLYLGSDKENPFSTDIKKMLDQCLLVFEMMGGYICGFEEKTVVVPIGIGPKPAIFDPSWYEEVTLYLLDTAANLHAFLTCCPLAVHMAVEMQIPYRLTYFYSRLYPELYNLINVERQMEHDWSKIKTRILDYMATGRSEFCNCFHVFSSSYIDDILQSRGDNKKQDKSLNKYIKMITAALEDEFFITDYHNLYDIESQIQMILDFHPDLDMMRTNYIVECIKTLPNVRNYQLKHKKSEQLIVPSPTVLKLESQVEIVPDAVTKISDEEIENRIRHVVDMLPHLGDGFVLQCLETYNYDPTQVISRVLEGTVKEELLAIPFGTIRVPPEPEPEQPILAYRGKKPTYKDAKEMLDDKAGIRDLLRKTSTLYADDDYDDRDEQQEQIHYKDAKEEEPYKYMENRFEGYDLVSDPSESSSDEAVDQGTVDKPKNFCEDPALVRERREAQRRGGGRGGKSQEVAGKPRGQGQDKNVQINRDRKNTNKSSKANHSRKTGSQWKRNKGMIPS